MNFKKKSDEVKIVFYSSIVDVQQTIITSWNYILFPKLFWPTTVRKNYFSDREKLLKFEAEGWEFAKFSRSLEKLIQTVTGQNNFW